MKCVFVDLGKHFGGAEKYLITVIRKWVEQGNEAIIVVKKNSLFEEEIRKNDLNAYVLSVNISIKDAIKVKKCIIKSKVDVVNVNGINSGVFLKLCNIKIPYVTTVHSNAEVDRIDKNVIVRKLFVCLENICLKKSRKIIVVSEAIKELLIRRGINENKIYTIHNGVKFIDYNEKAIRKNCTEVLKICYVGRLEKVKGCEYLIKALKELDSLNYKCDIYGDGTERESLENLVNQLGVDRNIEFKGFSNNIRNELQKYDVLVMPSLFEAFPLTIPEAMNAKTLLICSDVGGISKIIKDKENGYLFNCKDYNMLASILKTVYEEPLKQNRIIENAYHEFSVKYTEDIMINETFAILKNI
ncbi:glycosyltransferase family 4 protein [Agathobacter sp.]